MANIVELDDRNQEKLKSDISGIKAQIKAFACSLGPKEQHFPQKNNAKEAAKKAASGNAEENAVSGLIHRVSSETTNSVGDGSSTAAVLVGELLSNSLQQISAGADPFEIKEGLEKGMEHFEEFLYSVSQPILRPEQLLKVATTAARGDVEIGSLVVEAFESVGPNAPIHLKPSTEQESKVQVNKSNILNTRFPCPYCSGQQTMLKVEYEEPLLLLTNHKISSPSSITPLLDQLLPTERPLLIITNSADGEIPPAFILNHPKGIARISILRAPKSLEASTESLEDLALLTGGRMINKEKGEQLDDTSPGDLGTAAKLEVTNDFTSIVAGQGSGEKLSERKKQLKVLLNKTEDRQLKKQLKERLAFISGSSVTLRLADSSQSGFEDKRQRAETAIHVCRAALAAGMVPGGGIGFIRGYKALQSLKAINPDQEKGLEIFRQALLQPTLQIAENAGAAEREVIEESMRGSFDYGYNAANERFENLMETGIADATKVLLMATRNAVSASAHMLAKHSAGQPAVA